MTNDRFVSIGLTLAEGSFDQFIQFEKNRLGSLRISQPLRQREPDFPTKYKKPGLNAKNYSLPENPHIQGFWLTLKPSVN